MKILLNNTSLFKSLRPFNDLGFVPTMGGIHKGHLALINKSNKLCKKTIVSIFVNPKQFNNKKDLKSYPRNIKKDLKILKKSKKVDFVYLPKFKDIYKDKKKSKIKKTNSESLDIEHIIQSLGIKEFLNKFPDQLSGGQKQLVNLCRTLAIKSDFIILDEPMSSLDIKNKATVLSLLKEINKKYEIPILIISHSVEEIAQISDNVIILEKGKIVTYGNLSQIFLNKEFTNIFGKFESSSILEGIIFEKNSSLNITKILISGFEIVLPGEFKKIGEKIRVRIRARDILISKNINSDSITENQLFGNVQEIKGEDDTAFSELIIKIGNSQDFQFLLIRITKYQLEKLKVKKDDKIYILFKSTSFDRQAII